MRIFDPEVLVRDFRSSASPTRTRALEEMTDRPNGIVLVTGPTGSGKTTTLYSTLKRSPRRSERLHHRGPDRDGRGSLQPDAGAAQIDLGFAEGVRALMRQDPDIIMVGEIRDLETAEMAVQAALTGHLVLSTLHTNDAPSAVHAAARARRAAVSPQRHAERRHGAAPGAHALPALQAEGELHRARTSRLGRAGRAVEVEPPGTVYKPVGCLDCRMTGFMGRVGIYETLIFSPPSRSWSARRPTSRSARAGLQGRHEAAAHQRRDEGRLRPHHGG
jgi:general secretion pathway protein E